MSQRNQSFPTTLLIAIFLVIFSPLSTWAGCGSVPDPRSNPGGYRSWCRCKGGTPYTGSYGGPACRPGSSGGSFNPYEAAFGAALEPVSTAVRQVTECFLNPNCGPKARERERQQLLRRQRMEKQRIEDEYRREQEQHRRRIFEDKKLNILNQMRDTGSGSLSTRPLMPKDLSSPPASERSAGSATGLSANLTRISCSAYLLEKARDASANEQFVEAAYLSDEAAKFMSGETDSPAVVCPPLPEIPDVEGGPVQESLDEAEIIKTQLLLFSRLSSRSNRQMIMYQQALTQVDDAEKNIAAARAEKEQLEVRINELKAELNPAVPTEPTAVPLAESVPVPSPPPDPETASAMAEALAALQEAEAALDESEQQLAESVRARDQIEKEIDETKGYFNKANENPDQAETYLKELSPEATTKDVKQ